MRKKIKISLLILILTSISYSERFIFIPEQGYVVYQTTVKTIGIFPDKIKGINEDIIGEIIYSGDSLKGKIEIPVKSFKSGNTKRDRDVAKILRYEKNPDIIVEIVELNQEEFNKFLKNEKGSVVAKIKITAGGKSKIYDTLLEFSKDKENEVRVKTKINAKFTDFNIKPPTLGAFFKRAPDKILFSGDILFKVLREE